MLKTNINYILNSVGMCFCLSLVVHGSNYIKLLQIPKQVQPLLFCYLTMM